MIFKSFPTFNRDTCKSLFASQSYITSHFCKSESSHKSPSCKCKSSLKSLSCKTYAKHTQEDFEKTLKNLLKD